MTPAERLLERLERVRRSGDGWTALCPAHDDRNPSLSISEGQDGQALVHCFAGCPTEEVVEVVGLKMSDLWPSDAVDGVFRRDPETRVLADPRSRFAGSEPQVAEYARTLAEIPEVLKRLCELRGWTPEIIERRELGLDEGGRVTFPLRDARGHLVGLGATTRIRTAASIPNSRLTSVHAGSCSRRPRA